MKFILGKKIGMTQIFDESGTVIPVTVVDAQPNTVVQIKTKERDGYEAVQVGAGTKKKLTKALKGHLKDISNVRALREFRSLKIGDRELNRGDVIDVSAFAPGDTVKVSAASKGKGFQGVVKRHGFHGMPASHGHFAVQRHGGSIGQRFPQHTLKGVRMAGRMGHDRVTVRGLKVIHVDVEHGLLALKGAVPGNRGELLEIVKIR